MAILDWKETAIFELLQRLLKDYNSAYNLKDICIAAQAAPSTPAANDVYYYTGDTTATVFGVSNVAAGSFLVYSGSAWSAIAIPMPRKVKLGEDMDANGKKITNLPEASADTEPVRKKESVRQEDSFPCFQRFTAGDVNKEYSSWGIPVKLSSILAAFKSMKIYDPDVDSTLYYYKLAFIRRQNDDYAFQIYRRLKTGGSWSQLIYLHPTIELTPTGVSNIYGANGNFKIFAQLDWNLMPLGISEDLESSKTTVDPYFIIKPICIDGYASYNSDVALDARSKKITNLPEASTDTEPVRKKESVRLEDSFPCFQRFTAGDVNTVYNSSGYPVKLSSILAAFKSMKIYDPDIDSNLYYYKLAFIRRQNSDYALQIYRRLKTGGSWSQLIYLHPTIELAPTGVSNISGTNGNFKIFAQLDWNLMPLGISENLEVSKTDNDPYFIIKPNCIDGYGQVGINEKTAIDAAVASAVDINWTSNNYFDTSKIQIGNIIDSSGNLNTTSGWHMIKISLASWEGETTINFGNIATSRAMYYAFYNIANQKISFGQVGAPGYSGIASVAIPAGAAWFYWDIKATADDASIYDHAIISKGSNPITVWEAYNPVIIDINGIPFGAGGGEAYDQSLNKSDDVEFNLVKSGRASFSFWEWTDAPVWDGVAPAPAEILVGDAYVTPTGEMKVRLS